MPTIILNLLALLIGQTNSAVVVTHLESIEYPAIARDAQIQGSVQLNVRVAEDGNVSSATADSGHPALKEAAEKNIRRWKFAPGSEKQFSVTYEFVLEEPRTSTRPATRNYFDLPTHATVISSLPARTD